MTDVNNAHMIQARIIWRLYENSHNYNVSNYKLFKSVDDIRSFHPERRLELIVNLTKVVCDRRNEEYKANTNANLERLLTMGEYGCGKDKSNLKSKPIYVDMDEMRVPSDFIPKAMYKMKVKDGSMIDRKEYEDIEIMRKE